MKPKVWTLLLIVLVVLLTGCFGNPVIGEWSTVYFETQELKVAAAKVIAMTLLEDGTGTFVSTIGEAEAPFSATLTWTQDESDKAKIAIVVNHDGGLHFDGELKDGLLVLHKFPNSISKAFFSKNPDSFRMPEADSK